MWKLNKEKRLRLLLLSAFVLFSPSNTFGSAAAEPAKTPSSIVITDLPNNLPDFLAKYGVRTQTLNRATCTDATIVNCAASALSSSTYVAAFGAYADVALNLLASDNTRDRIAGVFLFSLPSGIPQMEGSKTVWLFTPAQGSPLINQAARRFALETTMAGDDVRYVQIPGTTPDNFLRFDRRHLAARIILDRLGKPSLPKKHRQMLALRALWRQPLFNNDDFWVYKNLIQVLPVSKHFNSELEFFFRAELYRLQAWPLQQYTALDLFGYLKATGRGDKRYLTVRNLRGEVSFFDLETLKGQRPVIVIGVDDEKNLYRLVNFYKSRQQYSWFNAAPPPSTRVRALGAFLHLRKPNGNKAVPLKLRSSLTAESFTVSDADPLRILRDQPALVRDIMVGYNRCINCHTYRGVGGSAHHIDAYTGAPAGGYALPLSGYPRQVMERFLYDQVNVARTIGVSTNHVRTDAHAPLLDALYKR